MRDEAQGGSNDRLFKQMDAQEQVYAPEQIAGAVPIEDEIDAASSPSSDRRAESATGDSGETPLVPTRPDPSVNTPIVAPAKPGSGDLRDTLDLSSGAQ